jgi:hypothetical protein
MLSQAQSLKVFSGEIGRLSRKFSQEMNSTNEQFGVQKKKRNVAKFPYETRALSLRPRVLALKFRILNTLRIIVASDGSFLVKAA